MFHVKRCAEFESLRVAEAFRRQDCGHGNDLCITRGVRGYYKGPVQDPHSRFRVSANAPRWQGKNAGLLANCLGKLSDWVRTDTALFNVFHVKRRLRTATTMQGVFIKA